MKTPCISRHPDTWVLSTEERRCWTIRLSSRRDGLSRTLLRRPSSRYASPRLQRHCRQWSLSSSRVQENSLARAKRPDKRRDQERIESEIRPSDAVRSRTVCYRSGVRPEKLESGTSAYRIKDMHLFQRPAWLVRSHRRPQNLLAQGQRDSRSTARSASGVGPTALRTLTDCGFAPTDAVSEVP